MGTITWVRSILCVVAVVAAMSWAGPAAAQSNGDALCAQALAAAQGGATQFQGKQIVYGSGGSGDQVVLGSDGPDVLDGGSGSDLVCGFGGDDVLYGGSSPDTLVGGAGVDELYGGSGNDTLYGSQGEVIDGGSNRNNLVVPPTQVDLVIGPLVGSYCSVTFIVNGGVPDALYSLSAVVLNSGAQSPDTLPGAKRTDANGNINTEVYVFESGATLISAEVYLDDTNALIAAFDINEICGG